MVKHVLDNRGYVIQKNSITLKKLEQLKKALTVTPNYNKDYQKNVESFEVFVETDDEIIIPRFYGKEKLKNQDENFNLEDAKVDFEFIGKLRSNQQELVDDVLPKIKQDGGGILQLHTGYGKTTLSLFLAASLGLKTLVVVHKTFLQDQWYDRIKQFTNASIGLIRQKKVDVKDKDIVIGMLQSLSMIDYDKSIFKDFGLIIFDECFPADTQIVTNKGLYKIGELYDLWKKNKQLPLIKSYNENNKCFEYKQITHAWQKNTNEIVRITFDNNIIDCTLNHKFLTSNGYKEAINLTRNDQVVFNNNIYQTIHSIEIVNHNINVYDIEVKDNHNFIVTNNNTENGPVVHNCHHTPSKVFSRILLKFTPKYTIGLSATPNRKDGLTKVIKWFVGDILAKVERKGDNSVYIKTFEYKSNDKLFVEKKRWINGGIKPDPVKMITNMYKIKSRNNFIANIINNLRKIDERKILILSGRIEHLKQLKKIVDTYIEEDIVSGICCPNEIQTAFYIGEMKEYERKDAEDADIIFGTYSMAEEGLDIPGLNTLILATPKKDVVQSIGRILRKPIQEGDINPLVIDVVDNMSCFTHWGNQRLEYYKNKKYTIDKYKAYNDNVISFKDFMLYENMLTNKDLNKNPTLDIRKEYILKIFGKDTYEFESELDFMNFPEKIFNYNSDYKEIFTINHEFNKKMIDNE